MLTFQDSQEIIANQAKRGLDKKKLAANTYLRKVDDSCYVIALHSTDIIYITSRAGETIYRLNSGGYQTVTTKDRLNSFSPARIYQKRGVWYVGDFGVDDVIYFDGIEVDIKGVVVNSRSAPKAFIHKKKRLDRMINEYIRGFANDAIQNGLGMPSGGDCWLCKIHAQGNSMATDDFQHVYFHLQEKYYTRSFLYYCLKLHGYSNPGFNWQLISANCERGLDDSLKRELRYGFSKMKARLMSFVELEEETENQAVAA